MLTKITTVLAVLVLHCGLLAQTNRGSLRIEFSWQYQYDVPKLNLPAFTTIRGQVFSLTTLRYYVGNIALHNTNGSTVHTHGYYLIGKDEEGQGAFQLDSLPVGAYDEISFIVGVDSSDNVAGPREGDLDPLNGMYWTWATGYIFFKLEGTSVSSPQPKHIIEYHLGGFSAPSNNIQHITLPLRHPLVIQADQQKSMEIAFDVAEFMNAHGGIDFVATSSVTDAIHAVPLAPRLKGAFRVR